MSTHDTMNANGTMNANDTMNATIPIDRAAAITERIAARYPLLYLVTGDAEDTHKLVRGAATACAVAIDTVRAGAGDPVAATVKAMERAVASTERRAIVVEHGHQLLQSAPFVRLVAERLRDLERAGHHLVLLAPLSRPCPELDSERVVLSVPLPGAEELKPAIFAAFSGTGALVDGALVEAAIQAAKGMTMAQLRRALRRVRCQGGAPDASWVTALRAEKRDLVGHSGVLEIVEQSPGIDSVGGLDTLKDWLGRRRKAMGPGALEFGLPQPRGVLLIGVQGCGKSLFAKATAAELGLPLLRFDLGRLFTRDAAPDERLRQALSVTEAMAPVVLWVDEIDKSFASAMDGAATTARIFGTFLTWLAEHRGGVFVAATANRVDHLPAELMRKGRFDDTFFVDLPDVEVRGEILAIHIQKSGRDPAGYDLAGLARLADRLTGAELEQAVIEALGIAFGKDRELQNADIERALRETVPFVETYEEQVKTLREWARKRARSAGKDRSLRDLFVEANAVAEKWRT